jgi:hypothetical protein
MIPNYIVPSEYEMMEALSKNTGVSVVWNCNAKAFIYDKKNYKRYGIVSKCLLRKFFVIG